MMYRLLIVDDEPVIVNGLVQLFQENPDFDLDLCKAYSAVEALEIAKRTKLDILISDIRMPQKNGLQFIDELVYYWPSCRVIFLTGYSDFQYAYEAIQRNVDHYILKTEGIEPVFDAVKSAMNRLEEDNRSRLQQEKAERHIQLAQPLLKKEMLEAMLQGEALPSLISQHRFQDVELSLSLDRPSFLLVGQIDRQDEHKGKLLKSLQRVLSNHMPISVANENIIYEGQALIYLLQSDEFLLGRIRGEQADSESSESGFVSYMKGILELVQNECERLLGFQASFGISGNVTEKWDTAHLHVEAMRNMIQQRVAFGQTMVVIDYEKWREKDTTLHNEADTIQDSFKKMLIEQIHQYVHEHLSGDLSLTAIADEMHFNPSYLSRYYKQITGRNLLEYIQSVKLQTAIDLMNHTNMKLVDIAAKSGFDSPSYFTTFFKKMTGVSPQHFRKSQ